MPVNRAVFATFIAIQIAGCTSFKPYQPATAGHVPDNRLQRVLDQAVNEFKLPGLQAGVIFPDGTVMLASSGTVDFERQKAGISNQDVFRIGSTTKMFVAALIGRLMERGLLSYDDTIDKWFPDIPSASSITVRALLNQTSGIRESLFTNPLILTKSVLSSTRHWDAQAVVHDIMKNMKVTPVGQRSFVYANNNYLLLGLIAEKVGKDGIANQLESEFFRPLGMKNTYFLPHYRQLPERLISGYDEYIPLGPHVIEPSNTSWSTLAFSAGSMASTSADLLTWLDALFHSRVLKPETLQVGRIFVNARNNGRDNSIVGYGLGLAQYELDGYTMEGHPGGGFGGECFPFHLPDKDVSIVVQYNWSKKDNPAGKVLVARIIEQVINSPLH